MSIDITRLSELSDLIGKCQQYHIKFMLLFTIDECPYCNQILPEWKKASLIQKDVIFANIECANFKQAVKNLFQITTCPLVILCDEAGGIHKLDMDRNARAIAQAALKTYKH